jgi:hypothetical protein
MRAAYQGYMRIGKSIDERIKEYPQSVWQEG